MVATKTLEPFKTVLARQKPEIPGEPVVMKEFSNEFPKSAGNPVKGAYSKHGFWYKIIDGTEKHFGQLVEVSRNQDKYFINEDHLHVWRNAYGESNVTFLAIINLKDEVMGGIIGIKSSDLLHIGGYFMKEENRHSGIGSIVFRTLTDKYLTSNVVFQAMHHLLPSVGKFGLKAQEGRQFIHVKVTNADGFPQLKSCSKVIDALSTDQEKALLAFDRSISGETRPVISLISLQDSSIAASFDSQGNCNGYGICREIGGEFVKRIIVGPLYAKSEETAEALIQKLFKKYYNPEHDYDFDIDCFAIYRRTVDFIIPDGNRKIQSLLLKLKGEKGTIEKQRMTYQTSSRSNLPTVAMEHVFAVGDLHSATI